MLVKNINYSARFLLKCYILYRPSHVGSEGIPREKRGTDHYRPSSTEAKLYLLLLHIYRVRINYRGNLQTHIFTNTGQKYIMLPPFERGMFTVS